MPPSMFIKVSGKFLNLKIHCLTLVGEVKLKKSALITSPQ